MSAPVLLVIDNEPGVPSLVTGAVAGTGYRTIVHVSAAGALAVLANEPVDVALVDPSTPDLGSLDAIRAIRELQPECGVIVMTAHPSAGGAIEAVKLGALDYLTKPLDVAHLQQLLNAARDAVSRRAELFTSEGATARRLELCGMIGRSAVMQQLFGLVRRIAPHARTALITGETGAGKERIARAIHALGPCHARAFVTVDCSSPGETVFDSELLDLAGGGTLFLDGVDALSFGMQAKLLRMMETGEVARAESLRPAAIDVRIVAATNRDLRAEVGAGRFRADLLGRLALVELSVAPLRERREDIPYLTAAFVNEFGGRFGKQIVGVSVGAEQILMSGTWPGNVRELRNVLERACMLADGRVLTGREFVGAIVTGEDSRARPRHTTATPSAAQDLGEVEREHIARVLADARGNKQAAARRLGISRRTLYRRLERHGLMQARRACLAR